MCGGVIGVSDTLLLIAMGVGYAVLYLAKREEKGTRLIGYAISALIISSAIGYLFLNLLMQRRFYGPKARCYQKMMMQQPGMSPKMPAMKR
jgi:hypothetical protein